MMRRLAILLWIFCVFALIGCESDYPSDQAKKPIVLVSSPPYAYLTALIAKGTVQVECLTPPGTNPHLLELPPKQVQKILKSALWLRLGEPMEKKFLDIFRDRNPHLKIADLSDGIEMIDLPHEHHDGICQHDGQDRHFWMSPTVAKQQLKKIAASLAALYPHNADVYQKNLAAGIDELTELDREVHALLASKRPQAIAISHPALGYFCRDYGIEQLSVETDGKEPLPSEIDEFVEQIEKKNVSTIFLLPQHNNQGAVRIADHLGLRVQTIDPYAANYPAAVREVANAIAKEP